MDSITIRKETDSATGIEKTDFASPAHPEEQSLEEASTVTERAPEREVILDADSHTLPLAAELLQPLPDHPPPSVTERFEHALQLRMTQLALTELIEGPEGTEEKWIEVFHWFAKRKGPERDQSREIFHACLAVPRYALTSSLPERTSMETSGRSLEAKSDSYDPRSISSLHSDANGEYTLKPATIPSSPTASHDEKGTIIQNGKYKSSFDDTEKDKDKDKSAGKKVQKMLKNRVHKEQRRISTIGRKIGHGVGRQRGGLTLRRTSSTPSKHEPFRFCF